MPKDLKKNLADLPEVGADIDEKSEFYRRNVVPIDRGWAWVICFAGFLVYFVFGISNQTLVVLFVELINMYDTTVTMGSLIFMFSVFSVGTMSIISTNFLAPRYGERAVVSVAGFFNMCGSLGLSFSPTIGAFIVWAVLKGLATGAVFVPSISLIRLYFHNRRSIAQILANVGQSFAVIMVPPFIRIIRKHYGISGTFIVVAGIELHMTIAGLLLRPISAYKYRPRISKRVSKAKAMEEVMISEDYNEFKLDPKYNILVKRLSNQATGIRTSWTRSSSDKSEPRKSMVFQAPLLFRRHSSVVDPTKSKMKLSEDGNLTSDMDKNQKEKLQNINENKFSVNRECASGPPKPDCSNNSNDKSVVDKQPNEYVVPSTGSGGDATMSLLVNSTEGASERNLKSSASNNQSKNAQNTNENKFSALRESARRSRVSGLGKLCGSRVSGHREHDSSRVSGHREHDSSRVSGHREHDSSRVSGVRRLDSSHSVASKQPSDEVIPDARKDNLTPGGSATMELFVISIEEAADRRWLFRMVLLATIPGSANLYVRNYIPAMTEGQGATLDQSAILLTIVGATDMVSRLCVGLFADTHVLTSVQIIIITQLCLATVCHCLRFFVGFQSLLAFVMLMGCFVGTRISVLPLLSMEIVGVEHMPQALSIISTIGALSSAFMNPIFGSVAQTDGNFERVMNLVGGCFTVSSMIMIMMPFVLKLRRMARARKAKNLARNAANLAENQRSSQENDGSFEDEIRVGVNASSSVDMRKKSSIKERDPSATVLNRSEIAPVVKANRREVDL